MMDSTRNVAQSVGDAQRNKLIVIYFSSATGVDTRRFDAGGFGGAVHQREVAGQTVPSQRTATIEMPTETSTGMG